MVNKIVCILVLTLLISSALPAVGRLNETNSHKSNLTENLNMNQKIDVFKNYKLHLLNRPKMDKLDGEPSDIWTIGEIWTYELVNIDRTIEAIRLIIEGGDLSLTLESSNPDYNLNLDGNIDRGKLILNLYSDITIEGELRNAKLEGEMLFRKSDLGIERINTIITGKLAIKTNIPDLPFQIPAVPAAFEFDIIFNFEPPLILIDFPLNVSKIWDLPGTNVTINGKMSSFWFWFIKFVNDIINILPPELEDLFSDVTLSNPDIYVEKVLDLYYGTNIIPIPEFPNMFYCSAKEIRNVPAGNFDTYNITVPGTYGYLFYAPEVHHIVDITFEDFHLKLKKHGHPRFANTRVISYGV